MVKKYRKKPVVIEAMQYTGDREEVTAFVPEKFLKMFINSDGSTADIGIKTMEGTMFFDTGTYIVKGIEGEFYPCKAFIFEASYEPVD